MKKKIEYVQYNYQITTKTIQRKKILKSILFQIVLNKTRTAKKYKRNKKKEK